MSYRVFVRRAAERDITQAQRWYEQQRAGLAKEFQSELEELVDRLAQTPLIYPVLYRNVYRAMLRRFPYLIWYRVEKETVTVLAYTHGRIDPAGIPARLK